MQQTVIFGQSFAHSRPFTFPYDSFLPLPSPLPLSPPSISFPHCLFSTFPFISLFPPSLSSLPPARSPLYSHISSTLQGLPTIRTFGNQSVALDHFHKYQNEHTQVSGVSQVSNCGIFQYAEFCVDNPKEPLKCFTNKKELQHSLGNVHLKETRVAFNFIMGRYGSPYDDIIYVAVIDSF